MVADFLARKHNASVAHQVFQNGKFLGRKRHRHAAAAYGAGRAVHREVCHSEHVADAGAGPARHHTKPRQQLVKGKGLYQIIVRTGIQAGHPVFNAVLRGKQNHRRTVALGAHAPQHLQAADARQHDVQHHGVIFRPQQVIQRVAASKAPVHAVMRRLQLLYQQLVQRLLVFHHQNPHFRHLGFWFFRAPAQCPLRPF